MTTTFKDFITAFKGWNATLMKNSRAKAYSACQGDVQKHEFAKTITKANLELDPAIVFHGKNQERAEAARSRGNRFYANGNYTAALQAYNEAIILAPWNDADPEYRELALALANRSAVFHMLRRYAECVRDVDDAIRLGYPADPMKMKKLLIRKARAFLAAGCPSDAVLCLRVEGPAMQVCSEDVREIKKLEGDMKDYADLLNLAMEVEKKAIQKGLPTSKRMNTKCPTLAKMMEERKKFSLKNGPSKTFLSASSVVEMKHNDEVGRHMVAREDVKAGDVILMEPAFVSSIMDCFSLDHCYSCHLWTDSPFPCTKCSKVVFCSSSCASGPKAELHARECPFWYTLVSDALHMGNAKNFASPNDLGPQLIMAVRTVLMKTPSEWRDFMSSYPGNSPGEADKFASIPSKTYRSNDYANVFCLVKNEEKYFRLPSLMAAFASVFAMAVLKKAHFVPPNDLSPELESFLGGIIFRHVINYTSNWNYATEASWFLQKDASAIDVAAVVHPTLELFNYSCHPNLLAAHYGDVVVVRARRPIKKGQELTHPFRGEFFAWDLDARRTVAALLGYKCECRACEEDWGGDPELFAVHNARGHKIKCPFCSRGLGMFRNFIHKLQTTPARAECNGCGADAKKLQVSFEYKLGTVVRDVIAEWKKIPCDLDKVFTFIEELSSLCVDPSYIVTDTEHLAMWGAYQRGNKRCDDFVPPYPCYSGLRKLFVPEIAGQGTDCGCCDAADHEFKYI